MAESPKLQDQRVGIDLPPEGTSVPAVLPAPDVVALRREDLAACLAGYRQAAGARGSRVLYALGFGGLVASVALLEIGQRAAWPELLAVPILLAGLGALGGAWRLAVRRDAALRGRYQLACPACDRDLLSAADLWTKRAIPADIALSTGRCPHCHAEVLAE